MNLVLKMVVQREEKLEFVLVDLKVDLSVER